MPPSPDQNSCIEAGILDNALVMITVVEEDGRIVTWNHAAETITGYTHDEVIGNNTIWRSLYPDKEYRKKITRRIADILSTNNSFENFETTIRTRSGDVRTILWNTKRIMVGGISRAVAVGVDITRERQATMFRESIIDNAHILMAVLDPQGTIEVWNKAAEIITGYSAAEVLGKNDIWKKLYPDAEYRRKITRRISSIISQQDFFENLETTILTKSGSRRIISWNTRQIGSEGIIHEIAIGRDITEQRQAEESLVAYMSEMTLRLKQPVGIVSSTLRESAQMIRDGLLTTEEITVLLEGQARNTEKIAENIQEFQTAIVARSQAIPESYRKFLER
jgi:PAS domain S-box-containing protein